MGFLGDVGRAVGSVVKTTLDPIGLTDNITRGLPGTNVITGGKGPGGIIGGGGILGGGQKPAAAPPAAPPGPDYMAQARAAVQAAEIAAGATRDTNRTQLDIAKQQAAAGMTASRNSAIGAILGAAMGAHQTTQEIKQWLPHESGAATIKSWELAQKWNTTLQMKQAGYQDVAINYALSGKDGRALFKDPQWNAMKMAEDLKKDTLASINMFGIKSASNPHGVAMSKEDYIELMSFKDPKSIMEVDPAVAKERNAKFDSWEAEMRKKGLGMVVDIYKNPQLSGDSLLAMKGKDPLIDPSLMPLLQAVTGTDGKAGGLGIGGQQQETENARMGMTSPMSRKDYVESQQKMSALSTTGAKPKVSYEDYLKNFQQTTAASKLKPGEERVVQKGGGAVQGSASADLSDVWKQAMAGEQNPKTEEIKKLMEAGVIDKYGMINAGQLMTYVPPELTAAPEFSVTRNITDQEKTMLTDEFNKFSQITVDPKNIKTESLGSGVTRKTLMNADGSISGSMMEGYMTNAMGESVFVSMQGTRLQNWYDKMSMINGLGPLFPGIMAPVTDSELNGTFEPGFWDAAKSSQPKGADMSGDFDAFRSGLGKSKQGNLGAPPPPKSTNNKPSGYSGAPLRAGG